MAVILDLLPTTDSHGTNQSLKIYCDLIDAHGRSVNSVSVIKTSASRALYNHVSSVKGLLNHFNFFFVAYFLSFKWFI